MKVKKLIVVAHPRPARDRVPHDEAEPLAGAAQERALRRVAWALLDVDAADLERGEEERRRVDQDGDGALKSCTRAPPTAGPATNDTERDALSFEFASR